MEKSARLQNAEPTSRRSQSDCKMQGVDVLAASDLIFLLQLEIVKHTM